jgi:hypothetical protein
MSDIHPDHFEMRRLESLSNTIFGVAMTLLAYDLPKARRVRERPDLDRSLPALRRAIVGADPQLHHRRTRTALAST